MALKSLKNLKNTLIRWFRYIEGILYALKAVISERQFIYISCVLVGISSALAVIVLKSFAHWVYETATQLDYLYKLPYSYTILPIIGILLTVFVIHTFLGGHIEKGTNKVLIAIAKKSGIMPRKQMYSQILTASLTVGLGGSAGLESPITITGAAFGSNYAREYQLSYKSRTLLLACGVASGIAAAFNAPIAGVLFAIEIVLADMSVTAFIPLMISSATGAIMANIVLKDNILLSFKTPLLFQFQQTPFYILLGICCGFFAIYHARMFRLIEEKLNDWKINRYAKALFGATLLGVLLFLFPTLFGEGYESIKLLAFDDAKRILDNTLLEKFNHKKWIVLAFVIFTLIFKSVATGLTLGSGGNGGNFAPSLFAGSYLGFSLAKILELVGFKNLPVENFTIIGMAGLLSGLFHAPLTALFLIAEITGSYSLMVPLLIVSSISFAITKRYEKHAMDVYYLAKKGMVFTSDKDSNLLSKIKWNTFIEPIIILKDTLPIDQMLQKIMHNPNAHFLITNRDGKYMGMLNINEFIASYLYKNQYYNLQDFITYIPTISQKATTRSVLRVMKKNNISKLVVTDQNTFVGIIYQLPIMESYRENVINLRIE